MGIFTSVILAYLIGSFPSAVWIGKLFYKTDIREHGSKNAGATNAIRVLGKKPGIIVLAIDMFKGWIAVHLAVFSHYKLDSVEFINLQVILGLVALIGHIFPLFANFNGGKGVATLVGVMFAIHPIAAFISIVVFIIVLLVFKYVSLGSIIAAVLFPLIMLLIFKINIPSLIFFSVFIPTVIIITHQKNIERLIKKEETKVKIFKRKN